MLSMEDLMKRMWNKKESITMPGNQTPSGFSSVGSCHSPNTVTTLALFAPTNKNKQSEYKQAVNLLNYTIDKLKSVKPEQSNADKLFYTITLSFFKKLPRREAYRLAFDNAIENLEELKSQLEIKDNYIAARSIESLVVSNLEQCLDMLDAHESTETLRKFSYYFPRFIVFDNKINIPLLKQYQKEEQEKSSHSCVSLSEL